MNSCISIVLDNHFKSLENKYKVNDFFKKWYYNINLRKEMSKNKISDKEFKLIVNKVFKKYSKTFKKLAESETEDKIKELKDDNSKKYGSSIITGSCFENNR